MEESYHGTLNSKTLNMVKLLPSTMADPVVNVGASDATLVVPGREKTTQLNIIRRERNTVWCVCQC